MRINEIDIEIKSIRSDEPLKPKFNLSLRSGVFFKKTYPASYIGSIRFYKKLDDGRYKLIWEILPNGNSEKLDNLEVTYGQTLLYYDEKITLVEELMIGKEYRIVVNAFEQVAGKDFKIE